LPILPAAQLVQGAPLVLNLPLVQAMQADFRVWPSLDVDFPFGQAMQSANASFPTALHALKNTYLPFGQLVHADPAVEYLPTAQFVHAAALAVGLAVAVLPLAQAMHPASLTAPPTSLPCLPAGQFEQVVVPPAENLPAAQVAQPAAVALVLPYLPAPQVVHAAAPAMANFAVPQTVHWSLATVAPYLPAAQPMQEPINVAPSVVPYLPATQPMHASAFEAAVLPALVSWLVHLPLVQLLQVFEDCPVSSARVPELKVDLPAAQTWHVSVVCPEPVLNLPTAQSLHASPALAVSNHFPATHTTQAPDAAEPAGDEFPAVHLSLQAFCREASAAYLPMAHCVHVTAAPVEYVPARQAVQPAALVTCAAVAPLLPAGHGLQAAAVAAPDENVPIAQSVHVVCGSVL
jgi:hypothetical protein